MITPEYVRVMAAYNAEMNRRVYGAAAILSEEQRRQDCGAFWLSIHGTLSHLLWGDRMWMSRFDGWEKPQVKIADSGRFFDGPFAEMTLARAAVDEGLSAWAEHVDAEWLAGTLTWFSGATHGEVTRPRALLVIHFFNHQTHHRGQAHALITAAGEKTGDTDLMILVTGTE